MVRPERVRADLPAGHTEPAPRRRREAVAKTNHRSRLTRSGPLGLRCRSLRGFGPGGEHSGSGSSEPQSTGTEGAARRQPTRDPGAADRLRPGRSSEGFGRKSTAGERPFGGTGAVPLSLASVGDGVRPGAGGEENPERVEAPAEGSLGVFRAFSPPRWSGSQCRVGVEEAGGGARRISTGPKFGSALFPLSRGRVPPCREDGWGSRRVTAKCHRPPIRPGREIRNRARKRSTDLICAVGELRMFLSNPEGVAASAETLSGFLASRHAVSLRCVPGAALAASRRVSIGWLDGSRNIGTRRENDVAIWLDGPGSPDLRCPRAATGNRGGTG